MNNLQLYLNDTLIDLSEDSPVALSFAINNLADVKNQNSNTSNQFKVPLTVNNRKTLGIPDTIGLISDLPYRKYDAKIIQDGIEILPGGFGELNNVTDNYAAITVLSGNVDFFDLITGKIYDMAQQLQAYEHEWTLDNVFASQAKTGGWIYPIIDYGMIPEGYTSYQVWAQDLRPAFFLHTIVEEIAKQTGFTISGSLLQIPLYQKLLIAFANDDFEHGELFKQQQDNLSCSATNGSYGQAFPSQSDGGLVNINTATSNPSGSYDSVNSVYVAKQTIQVTFQFKYSMKCRDIHRGGSAPAIRIIVVKRNTGGGETEIANNRHEAVQDAGRFNPGEFSFYEGQEINESIVLNTGESLFIKWRSEPGHDRIEADIYPNAQLFITNNKTNVNYKQKVQVEKIFPDVTQKDLLKDAFQKFGIVCSTDSYNKRIEFAQFGDIVKNIPIANDWSGKMVDQGKGLYFQIGDYAQTNNMLYKPDDAVPKGLGDSVININDQTLPVEVDLFQSIFAASVMRPYFGGSCAQIIKVDPTDATKEFKVKTEPRILVDRKVNMMDTGLKLNLVDGEKTRTVNGIASIPYFTGQIENLSFDYLRKTYYHEFEQVLNKTKKIVRYFMFTPIDIANLNLLIPVYLSQESAYFYVSTIASYVKGKQTKVELIRL